MSYEKKEKMYGAHIQFATELSFLALPEGWQELTDAFGRTLYIHAESPRRYIEVPSAMTPMGRSSGGSALTGLRNLGNTCYMNTVLQCLCNTVPLAQYFLDDAFRGHINRTNETGSVELVEAFGELLKLLWGGGTEPVSPASFKNSLGKVNLDFAGFQQQDCQEFYSCLLNGLHVGLNRALPQEDAVEPSLDHLGDAEFAREKWRLHRLRHSSVVVDYFQGQFKSTIRCQTCSHQSSQCEPFFELSLPLPACAGRTEIEACLKEFEKSERLTGNESFHCSNCDCKQDAVKTITISKLPQILVIHLKRFYYSQGDVACKLTKKVEFGSNLEITEMGGGSPRSYDLYGVANHYGTPAGGHYTAYGKNAETNQWHEFNDDSVTSIRADEVCSPAAYMLFYSSIAA